MTLMTHTIEQALVGIAGAGSVLADEPMSAHTTFRVGGPADYFVSPASAEQVRGVIACCKDAGIEYFVMGRGSNLLVADAGLRGVVVRLGDSFSDVELREDGSVTAQAGASNARIAHAAQQAGFAGFEFAAGIPGTIGGAAIMNAGAYDGELKQVARSVSCLTPVGEAVMLNAAQAQWGYRHSMMAGAGYIVLSVDLQLSPGDPEAIRERMVELARRRADKQPLDLPSAGSTFKRPKGHFAGKLIQDAGMQGHTVGAAQVSLKHAGFVVNRGGATASDIRQVIEDVQERVFDRFGVRLEPEVRMWGF